MKKTDHDSVSIFVVSGGKGVTGHTIVQTLIIQYPEDSLKVKLIPDVRTEKKILEVIKKVKEANGVLAHTMVNSDLLSYLQNRHLQRIMCSSRTSYFFWFRCI